MSEILLVLTLAAQSVGISPDLLIAVCKVETNLKHVDTEKDGKTTSYGVCQIKLETAQFMGKVHRVQEMREFQPEDMRVLENNAKAAAYYLKYQLKRYDNNHCKAVAAYNAGRYKESQENPGKPFNQAYVDKVKEELSAPELLSCDNFLAVND